MAFPIAAAIIGSAVLGAYSSNKAAKAQAGAANQAGAISQAQYEQTRADLDPWRQAGEVSLEELMFRLGLAPNRAGGQLEAPTREQYTTTTPGKPAIPRSYDPLSAGWGMEPRAAIPGTTSFDEAGYNAALGKYNAGLTTMQQDGTSGELLRPFSLAEFEESPAYQFNLEQGEKAINKGAAARGMYYAPQTLQDLGKYSQGVASNEFQNAFSNYNTNMNNIWNRLYGMSGSGQNAAAQLGGFGERAAGQQGEAAMGAGNARAAGIVGGANAITGGVSDAYNNYLLSQVLSQYQQPVYGSGDFRYSGSPTVRGH